MDYNSLTTQIQNYANRTDVFFISQIPDFINQAITRIYSEAKNIGFQTILSTETLTQGNRLVTKPTVAPLQWKETISFQYTITGTSPFITYLLPRSYEFCTTYAPNVNIRSAPVFYADLSYTQFYIVPTPDIAYPYTLTYLGTPLFNTVNATNFLTERYPSLLLYACLLEMTPFLKDDERVPVFESLYNRALQNINKDTKKLYIDRISKRNKD